MSALQYARQNAGARGSGLLFLALQLVGAKAADKADYWSFKPAARPPVPVVSTTNWVRNPIDRFVLAKLEQEKLAPSPEADRLTLIRRLSFDLTGLPPTPDAVDRFLVDKNTDAYEHLVDRLLTSPRYGERWGRHWLDLVHYGETHGYDKDKPRLNAWPYRDYVIRSFNDDKPYSRFVEEQLAGDVLFPDEPDGVVATGFIAAGPWDFVGHVELPESKTDGLIARYNDRDDMVMTVMSTFQSLTVHCARCHDHKFDPITRKEYYGLQAVFAGVDRADRPYDSDQGTRKQRRILLSEKKPLEARFQSLTNKIAQISSLAIQRLAARLKEANEKFVALPKSDNHRQELEAEATRLGREREQLIDALLDDATRVELGAVTNHLAELDRKLDKLPQPKKVYAAAPDFEPSGSFVPPKGPRPVYLLARGDVKRPEEIVPPGTLGCVPDLEPRFELRDPADEGNRRTALAKWITDPKNMLTRRSIVNRVWQYHFGRGIVETPNDFGHMGALPTHPELLDWLAFWFLDHGESLKALHRLILTSATYRQTSDVKALKRLSVEPEHHAKSADERFNASTLQRSNEAAALDSDNRYLWRMNRTRLDAESIRDSMLFVSGKLDLTMGGPSVQQFYFKDDHSPTYDYTRYDIDSPGSYRRSVYRFIVRTVPDPFMDALDCPDASLLTAKRNTTTTALQALAILNNPFVVRQAEHFAERVSKVKADLIGQIEFAYRMAWSRPPTAEESNKLVAYAQKHSLMNACRLLFNSNEFMFVD